MFQAGDEELLACDKERARRLGDSRGRLREVGQGRQGGAYDPCPHRGRPFHQGHLERQERSQRGCQRVGDAPEFGRRVAQDVRGGPYHRSQHEQQPRGDPRRRGQQR